jgi:glycosyltransferase involved in cell wall biosynthesis
VDAHRPIAYVLKGFPRISELFIASEIHRVEALGLPVSLYVIKQADEVTTHPVVDRIAAVPRRLPAVGSLSKQSLRSWLRAHLRQFVPALRHAVRHHPRGFLRATGTAAMEAVRARRGHRLRAIYVKELLLAVALVEMIDADGGAARLHAHFAHGTTTVTWFASIISGVPFSFTAHAKDIYDGSLNPAGLLARKMRAATVVTTCTGANAEHLRALEPSAQVELVYHGLNADFSELVAGDRPSERPARLSIASVGRLVPKKGFDILLDAVRLLVDRGLDPVVAIAGESGPEHEALCRQISDLGIGDRVELVGVVSQTELLALYRRSSLFVLACRVDESGDRDGIPNVLVEAMAAGLPVVSTAVSGIPEVVHDGDTGLLVAPDDPRALADAIERIARDPALAGRLAEAARDLVATELDGDVLARRLAGILVGSRP